MREIKQISASKKHKIFCFCPTISVFCISLLMLVLACSCVFGFTIAENGVPKAVVVIDKDATEAQKYAADEFVKYTQKISGAVLEIKDEKNVKNNIFIRTKKNVKDEDRVNLKLVGSNLYIEGNTDRGTIYAVYEFFQKFYGVEFYTNDVEKIPSLEVFKTPNILNYSYVSPLYYRDCDFHNIDCDMSFYVKTKMNGTWKLKENTGGSVHLLGGVHSIDRLMPKSKYFKEHPEYYSFVNGQRKAGAESQLCFSNQEMREALLKEVLNQLRNAKNPHIISVSQNDNAAFCQCEECNKLYEKYQAKSGALLECINFIAREVKKEFPDVKVETLAYGPTLHNPVNIKAEDNVVIRICNIECNFSDPIENRDAKAPYNKISCRMLTGVDINACNKKFAGYMEAWGKIAKYIYVWDYNANFSNYHIAHPNFHVLKPNFDFFLKHNAMAIFAEGDRSNERASFNEIKSYIIFKLLWNPKLDDKELMTDFCQFVYKQGAEDILEIINILTNDVIEANVYMPTYVYNNKWISNDKMIQVIYLFQDALMKTKDEKIAYDKIYNMYLDFLYGAYLKEDKDWDYISRYCRLPWSDKYDYEKEFEEYNNAHGNTSMNEGHLITPDEKAKTFEKSDKVPDVCKEVADNDWFELDDRNFSLTDRLPQQKEDKNGSFDTVTWLTPDNEEWSLQLHCGGNILDYKKQGKKSVDVYVVCKSAGKKKDDGDCLQVIVYDNNVMTERFKGRVPVKEINDNTFSAVFVGTFDIRPAKSATFVVTPVKNAGCADNVIFDRVICIAK